tara:strand:- start:125 stop:700 length:576 start_codon:yes stop_codon:yes gene_type:complete
MSDNIYIYKSSSSEYESSSEEEIQIMGTPKEMKFNEHTNYIYNNLKVLPVVIKVLSKEMNNYTEFLVNFDEPIIIHKLCDVYLDNLVTFKCVQNNHIDQICFLLNIRELDIDTKSSENNMKGKIVIPNGNSSGGNVSTTHRNKKMNFISTIHPKMINTLSGSLTLLDGTSHIWDGPNEGVFTMEINFLFRN